MNPVTIGNKVFHLPFLDRIPIDEVDRANLSASIMEQGRVEMPVLCWNERSGSHHYFVVDGANRCQLAAYHRLEKVPVVLRSFASEDEAAEACDRLNFDRRQSSEVTMAAHRAERVARVAAARQEGKSLRTIACDEKVSTTQVVNDLKASGVHPPCTPEPSPPSPPPAGEPPPPPPPEPKVTGKDGKTYPKRRPASGRVVEDRIPGDDSAEEEGEAKAAAHTDDGKKAKKALSALGVVARACQDLGLFPAHRMALQALSTSLTNIARGRR